MPRHTSLKGAAGLSGEGLLADGLLLGRVGSSAKASGGRGGGLAAHVLGADGLIVKSAGGSGDSGLNECPSAHVLGLLLAPHELGVRVPRQSPRQRGVRKRRELLQPDQRHVLDAQRIAGVGL